MSKRFHKIRFNERTLELEEVPFGWRDFVVYGIKRLVYFGAIVAGSVWFFDNVLQSPMARAREREVAFLEGQIEDLKADLQQMDAVLQDMAERDDAIYRSIFGADPYPQHVRNPGVGGVDRNRSLRGYRHSDEIIALREGVAELQRRMVAQSRSFDEVLDLARNQKQMLQSIPAIQPVRNADLKSMASGYGYRIHPIYKVRKMHYGMDFAAPTGTEIFATGDGIVIEAERKYNGFGHYVVIKHGFGYQTLYAHMSVITVRPGQRVKRGEVIGLVGNTGTSVAPHLHYEVKKNGENVNPAHYYFNDLTPAQYEQMLAASSDLNQSFD